MKENSVFEDISQGAQRVGRKSGGIFQMVHLEASGAEAPQSENECQRQEHGFVGQIFVPLIGAAIFSLGMSCFLTFEYRGQKEWAADKAGFAPYDVTTTVEMPASVPAGVKELGRSLLTSTY